MCLQLISGLQATLDFLSLVELPNGTVYTVYTYSIFPILRSSCLEYCITPSVDCILLSRRLSALSLSLCLSLCVYISDSLVLLSRCVSVALSVLLSPVGFRCRGSTCYPMSWLVQRAKANGLSGLQDCMAPLHPR